MLWKMSKFIHIFACQLLILILVVDARKHHLNLEKDVRKYFSVTTFGFLSNGRLEVTLNRLSYSSSYLGVFGWTLTKTVSDSITPYLESHQDKCLLLDDSLVGDGNIEIVSFLLDVKNNEMKVNCSKMFTSLEIRPAVESNNNSNEEVQEHHHVAEQIHHLDKQKRSVLDQQVISNSSSVASVNSNGIAKTDHSAGKQNDEVISNSEKLNIIGETKKKKQSKVITTQEQKACSSSKIFFKREISGQWIDIFDLKFVVSMESMDSEGLYSLYFHNCANYGMLPTPVNLSILIVEQNGENFLSAGEIPLPHLYFLMSLVFFITGCIWICVLRRKKDETFKIHYLMGLLVFVKSFSLLFHGINFHIIAKDGSPMEAWAVLYYITHLLKGALLFITIVLIGTGWAFIKHILSDKDKKIFMIVIPLQVLANVAKIIMEESEEGESQHYTWREIFILVDLLCCGAILFPVVWSIRHLQEASQTDGKAAINLEKLKLFRHFYVMIVCYIYFTRIIVYLLKITVPFQYEWLDELFRETATLTFFILTGYNFRPTTSNPYFRLAQDDQLEIEEVITQSGFTEGMSKTLRSRDFAGQGEESIATKRESSHEYD